MADIRLATPKDMFELLMLVKEFTNDATELHRWNKDKTEQLLSNLMSNPEGVIFVSELDDEVVGFLAGVIQPSIISHMKIAIELAWFVNKNARGSARAIQLVSAFEGWAKDNGAEWVTMSDIPSISDLTPLYSKLGYSLTEKAHSKRII